MDRKQKERGSVLVTVAIMLVAILLMLILAIDVGVGYAERRKVQNAADAGSLAAAGVLAKGGTDTEIWNAIKKYTIDENQASSFTATYLPGGQAVGSGRPVDTIGVKLTVTGSAPTFFAQLIGQSTVTASSSGSGGFTPLDIVLVMDKSGSMDDDTCTFKRFFRTGQPCVGSPTATNCGDCGGQWILLWCYWPNLQRMSPAPAECGTVNTSATCRACQGHWVPPEQPISAAKAAANGFVDLNNPNLSHLALVTYSDFAKRDVPLTRTFSDVKNGINAITIDGNTNAEDGLQKSLDELAQNGRKEAIKFVVFLTDGQANKCSSGCFSCNSCWTPPGCCPAAVAAAKRVATTAASRFIVVYTIGLGVDADQGMLRDIAAITGGEYFYAPDAADLSVIYATIFERIQLRLVQ